MVTLDLQWVGFGILCAVLIVVGAIMWVLRRHRETEAGTLDVAALRAVSDELQRAQRASRGLVSDLGHELRTPIATLLTHLEILGLDDVGADVHAQSLQLAKQEAQRMSRLVDDMLELGRLETAETLVRRPLSLGALVEDIVAQTFPRAVAGAITMDVMCPAALPLVLGDADRLRQVVLNLLDNAFKYAGPGAHVTIELAVVDRDIVCSVCDDGPGIPDEHLPFVSQRFYRAGSEHIEGSGLGLALVAEILRRHDSGLEMTSSVGEDHGTCARFALPVASQSREAA